MNTQLSRKIKNFLLLMVMWIKCFVLQLEDGFFPPRYVIEDSFNYHLSHEYHLQGMGESDGGVNVVREMIYDTFHLLQTFQPNMHVKTSVHHSTYLVHNVQTKCT